MPHEFDATLHIIDDDPDAANLAASLCNLLRVKHRVWESSSAFCKEGLGVLGEADVLILDIYMPGKDAIETMLHLSRNGRAMPVILVSGKDDGTLTMAGSLATALGHHPVAKIQKPLTREKLTAGLRALKVDLAG